MVHGDDRKIMLIDFGLAKVVNTSGARTQGGTAFSSSREKFAGKEYHAGDDMWGFGCVLAELANRRALTGQPWITLPGEPSYLSSLIDGAKAFSQKIGDIVSGLLELNVKSRLSARGISRLLVAKAEAKVRTHTHTHTHSCNPGIKRLVEGL